MNLAESKIRNALEKAAQYHREDGLSPNDAIIKSAGEFSLNPPMVDRVIEAFNIAKTNAVLSRANDKTASFPVAERDVILDGVFGQGLGVKPGENKVASIEEDSFSEVPMSSGPLSFLGFDKTAGPEVQDHDVGRLIRDGISNLMELRSDLGKYAQDVLSTESEMASCMREIGNHFSLSENVGKYAEFEADILSERGEEARPSLDIIHRHFCPRETRCDWTPKIGTRAYVATAAHDNFEKLSELTDLFIRQEKDLADMRLDFARKKANFDSSVGEISGVVPKAVPTAADFFGAGDVAPHPISKSGAQIADGSAASFIGSPALGEPKVAAGAGDSVYDLASFGIDISPAMAAQKGVNNAITKTIGDSYEKADAINYDLPKAEGDQEMDNIRRSTILRDLMANDEIISKHKPADVQRVYSTMLAIAPNVTLYPGVVQSVLRSSLSQQAVDPFTAKQFADLEGQGMKNKMLAKGKVPPPGA